MIKYIIDRIETDYAVCEDEFGNTLNIKKKLIKGNLKEGSVILKINDKYNISEVETKKRKEEIDKLMEGMWENE